EAEYDQQYTVMIVSIFFILFMMILLSKILARIFKWSTSVESASILSTAFMNGGNYGIPVILFSLGKEALPFAVFYMVMLSLVINFFGVYYASRVSTGVMKGIKRVFLMPATWAAMIAFLFIGLDIVLLSGVYSTINMESE